MSTIHKTISSLHEIFHHKKENFKKESTILVEYLANADVIIFGAFYLESLANFMGDKVFNLEQQERYFSKQPHETWSRNKGKNNFIREIIELDSEKDLKDKLNHPESKTNEQLIACEIGNKDLYFSNSAIKLMGILKHENVDILWDVKRDDNNIDNTTLINWSQNETDAVLISYVNDIFSIRNHYAHGKTYVSEKSVYTIGELYQKRTVRLIQLYISEIIKIETKFNKILQSKGFSSISNTQLWETKE
ncbi:hypothetical protein BTO06_00395 [Tenacibaculum sp. SZ-18]|uniref:hypothetical protein n=1 Tax=Tenacibaculum sp. SZ-18 TaxID=754423 RepID=UPI000C2D36A3|nr:hypothetical protein [Tenacibaculum sp. SZ-18]AUC13696.1 hypothetical protein BTO06_00395 [Tenacibaculum sp. SZ-18]